MRHARLFPLAILGVLATMACQARPDFPLAQAVDSGERTQIRMLLDRGTDLEEAGGDGWRAVIWAVRQDHPDILRELLAAGADPNAPATRRNGWTPLMHAIHTRQSAEGPTARLGAIQTLLDGGADPNGRSRKGSTPLIMAAGYGATDMVAVARSGRGPTAPDAGRRDRSAGSGHRCERHRSLHPRTVPDRHRRGDAGSSTRPATRRPLRGPARAAAGAVERVPRRRAAGGRRESRALARDPRGEL